MSGHFDFQNMSLGGLPIGEMVAVSTVTGLILQAHPSVSHKHVEYMAAIARETPDYPVDLSVWVGIGSDRTMIWTARIYWRE